MGKKSVAALLLWAFAGWVSAACFSDQALAAGVSETQGPACFVKEGDVYLIRSAAELKYLAVLVNENREVEPGAAAQTASYLLTADLDLTEYCKDGEGWEPIGRKGYMDETGAYVEGGCFNGTFDGGNHVITGLYINRPDEQAQGLFGCRRICGPAIFPIRRTKTAMNFRRKRRRKLKISI